MTSVVAKEVPGARLDKGNFPGTTWYPMIGVRMVGLVAKRLLVLPALS